MLSVPLQPVSNQTLSVNLGGQSVQLNIYQKQTGLYIDVLVNNGLIIGGVICENVNRIVRDLYLGFIGDFVFVDIQGNDDPEFTGLGDRFQLIYLEAADLPTGVG